MAYHCVVCSQTALRATRLRQALTALKRIRFDSCGAEAARTSSPIHWRERCHFPALPFPCLQLVSGRAGDQPRR